MNASIKSNMFMSHVKGFIVLQCYVVDWYCVTRKYFLFKRYHFIDYHQLLKSMGRFQNTNEM